MPGSLVTTPPVTANSLSLGVTVSEAKDLCGYSGTGIVRAPPCPPPGALGFLPYLQPLSDLSAKTGWPWDSPVAREERVLLLVYGTRSASMPLFPPNRMQLSNVACLACGTGSCCPLPAASGKRHDPGIQGDP